MGLVSESMTAGALVPLDSTVEVLAPDLVLNPYFPGESYLDWSDPTVVVSVLGSLQPAGTRALERAGRVGAHGVHELVCGPVGLTPEGRVRVGAVQFTVVNVREFVPYTHAVVEEVTSGEETAAGGSAS